MLWAWHVGVQCRIRERPPRALPWRAGTAGRRPLRRAGRGCARLGQSLGPRRRAARGGLRGPGAEGPRHLSERGLLVRSPSRWEAISPCFSANCTSAAVIGAGAGVGVLPSCSSTSLVFCQRSLSSSLSCATMSFSTMPSSWSCQAFARNSWCSRWPEPRILGTVGAGSSCSSPSSRFAVCSALAAEGPSPAMLSGVCRKDAVKRWAPVSAASKRSMSAGRHSSESLSPRCAYCA
mmetsp:Transcript_57368/g.178287  ORF Transcript_57368/g.178287 Transcript_57368/m.178287 type:complete len:235 (+) Transcript_57368:37-741(+)